MGDLVFVELNLADRRLISRVISALQASDPSTARTARSIRGRFELKEADKEIDELITSEEFRFMREQAEFMKAVDAFKLSIAAGEDVKNPVKPESPEVDWDDLSAVGVRKFTVDSDVLNWLKEKIEKHDFSKEVALVDGRRTEIEIIVHPSMFDAIANLHDALVNIKPVERKKKGEEAES